MNDYVNIRDYTSALDILLPPFYLLVIWIIANFIKQKKMADNPEYRYFVYGLMAKIIGAIALGLVYIFYYGGGDTTNYFESGKAYVNLFFKNTDLFFEGWFGSERDDYSYFDEETGFSGYYHRDPNSFFVVRLLIPLTFLSFKSYFTLAILVATVTYTGVWKLYKVFISEFPELKKEMAIAIIFVPSCIFWGSGIMKDSFTLSAIGWFTYSFYYFFIRKKRKVIFILEMIIAAFIILSIKPYILFALLPGTILWLSNQQIKKINNKIMRTMTAPFLIAIGAAAGYLSLTQMGDSLGLYKVDSVLDRAVIVQQDMKAEYYNGKTFDIGNFDASFGSIVSKAPIAIFSGIFRPGIWDVRNVVMLISSLENSYLLLLTFLLLLKLKFIGFFNLITANPLLLFSMLFSLFFAFSVGLTVANFGSLVRLRIPELPFFVAGLFILRFLYERKSGVKLKL